jgi:hypothetical protein
MKNILMKLLGKYLKSSVPVSSIQINDIGLFEYDGNDEAWVKIIVFPFGNVRLCLDGNWDTTEAEGMIKPHEETIKWAIEISKNNHVFTTQVHDFISNQKSANADFLKFLESKKTNNFDEIHIYKTDKKRLEALVSYISDDGSEIWRVAYCDKEPVAFYSE